MQNLRDKLLKAGLVTEQQITKALSNDEPKRPQKNQQPNRAAQRGTPAPAPKSEEELQRAAAFAARDAEVAETRRKEAAKQAEAKQQSERARSLRALINGQRMEDTLGEVAFHFVRRSGRVGRLALTPAIAKLLEDGAAAVVEMPGETDPAILPSVAAKKAWTIDPRAIFFWAGPQKPIGFDDLPPIEGEPGEAPLETRGETAESAGAGEPSVS